jgi:hypothetical protein
MRGGLAAGLLISCLAGTGCGVRLDGSVQPDGNQGGPDGTPGIDAAPDIDGPVALGPWRAPERVLEAGTTAGEDDGSLSSNMLEMVFSIQDPAANNTKDLWYMSRPSVTGQWSAPVKLPFNVTGSSDETPRFSPDNLTLYFASNRAGGKGGLDIYKVRRTAVGGTWLAPEHLPNESTTGTDKWFMPCPNGNSYLTILGNDIGEGTLGSAPTVNAQLSDPTGTETGPFLFADCKTVYFASTRSGANRIYVSTRPSIGATWLMPQIVNDFIDLGLGGQQEDPFVSADQRTFVLVSDVLGSKDVYISTR